MRLRTIVDVVAALLLRLLLKLLDPAPTPKDHPHWRQP